MIIVMTSLGLTSSDLTAAAISQHNLSQGRSARMPTLSAPRFVAGDSLTTTDTGRAIGEDTSDVDFNVNEKTKTLGGAAV